MAEIRLVFVPRDQVCRDGLLVKEDCKTRRGVHNFFDAGLWLNADDLGKEVGNLGAM